MDSDAGFGRAIFAAALLLIGGVLDVIWGIAAIGDSKFFVNSTKFIISDLNTWGWIILVLGVLQLSAAVALSQAGTFGRWFGILAAGLSAIGALLSLPAYPLWSISIFALSLFVIHGLAIFGSEERAVEHAARR